MHSDILDKFIVSILIIIYQTGTCKGNITSSGFNGQIKDTIPENQVLYNGRVWRNLYAAVEGDQFLFSKEFLPGAVTMKGRTFSDVMIMYDIFKDEILTPYKPVGILQLNKELADSFSIYFLNKKYNFERIQDSKMEELNGYCNVIYKGGSELLVRYIKKIEKLADGGSYDKFYQVNRIFLERDGKINLISSKSDLLKVFNDYRKQIRNFIKKNGIIVSRGDAESFIPVLQFTDTLEKQK
jgi:hypothetical protein